MDENIDIFIFNDRVNLPVLEVSLPKKKNFLNTENIAIAQKYQTNKFCGSAFVYQMNVVNKKYIINYGQRILSLLRILSRQIKSFIHLYVILRLVP